MGSIDIQIFQKDQWYSNAIWWMSKDQLRKKQNSDALKNSAI